MNFRLPLYLLLPALLALAAPVDAHVTIAPAEVRAGSVDAITFRCPDESAHSTTTKFVIQLPQDHPMASVKLRPVPRWHATMTMRNGSVDTITWAGGSIAPGAYQNFTIVAGPIPSGATELVFKALQTYANGETVRWIELRGAGEPEPPYPAPILRVR